MGFVLRHDIPDYHHIDALEVTFYKDERKCVGLLNTRRVDSLNTILWCSRTAICNTPSILN